MDDLDRQLDRWARAGLITADQARAIRRAEKQDGRTSRAIPILAEVLAYVGAILALSAVAFIASQVWSDLAVAEQMGLLALTTGVLFAGGWLIREDDNPVRQRISAILWFASVGGIGWFADVVATELWDIENGYGLVIGPTITVYAILLYQYSQTSLQQIAVAGGVAFVCGGLSDIAGGSDWFGVFIWIAGATWIALTRAGPLTPRRTGFALGSLGVLVGPEVIIFEFFESPQAVGLVLGLASAGALLYLSVLFGETVLLGFGVVGLFIFLAQIVGEYLADGLGGPLALLISGVALLLVALVAVRLRGHVDNGPTAPGAGPENR